MMPHPHRLLVLLISDMKVGLILLAQRTAERLDALRCARGPQAPESIESYSTLRRPIGRLHYGVGHIFADLPPQRRADAGREPVVKPCPDSRVCHLRREVIKVRPAVCYAWCGRAGERELRQRLTEGLQRHPRRATFNAVSTGVFRMHGCIVERLPGRVTFGVRIV